MQRTITALLFIISISLLALPALEAEDAPTETKPWSVSVAYYGELITHPGAKLSLDWQLVGNEWYSLSASAAIGGYIHLRNNYAIFSGLELGQRFTAASGLFGDVILGAAYLHSFPHGTIYQLDATGTVSEVANLGQGGFRPSLSLGVGLDWSKISSVDLRNFLRLEVFGQYPYNNALLLHAAVQLGCSFTW